MVLKYKWPMQIQTEYNRPYTHNNKIILRLVQNNTKCAGTPKECQQGTVHGMPGVHTKYDYFVPLSNNIECLILYFLTLSDITLPVCCKTIRQSFNVISS